MRGRRDYLCGFDSFGILNLISSSIGGKRGGLEHTFGSDEDEAVRSIDVNWIGNI
jgi:hypothetical protein